MTTLSDAKVISFNRTTRDYDATFDGQYVGSFATFAQAEDALNDHALRLIEDGLVDQPLALLDAEPAEHLPEGWMRMPEGDILDTDGMRVKLADPSPSEPSPDLVDNDDGMPSLPNMRHDPDESIPPPWDGPCPRCHDDGRLCWSCGHLDTPSIGRKLVFLQHNDRPTLIQILRGTQRRFWPLLAQAYVAALGATEAGQTVPALGVVGLWELLTA